MLPTAPFVKRKAVVPPDQIQRFGPTQVLHMIHYDSPLSGVGQVLGAEEHLFTSPARLGNDDLCSLKEAGRFSDWKQFVVYGIGFQCYFTQLAAPDEGEASAEELYDLFVYYSRLHVRYQDAEKQVLWTDQLPAGGGVHGYTTTTDTFHLTNGMPMASAFFKLKEPLVVTPQKTFRLTLKWHSSIVNTAGAPVTQPDPRIRFNEAVHSAKLVRLNLHGIEGRDLSNG